MIKRKLDKKRAIWKLDDIDLSVSLDGARSRIWREKTGRTESEASGIKQPQRPRHNTTPAAEAAEAAEAAAEEPQQLLQRE